MSVKQVSIFLQNSPGRLAEVLTMLAENDIDVRAISISDTVDFGILRLIVNKPEECGEILAKKGITSSITNVLAIGIEDSPGSLAKVLTLLGSENINVDYAYAFISHTSQLACIIMRVSEEERASEVLKRAGVSLLPPEEVYNF